MSVAYNHVNRQFQAKTAQHENIDISESIEPIESKFEDLPETLICTSWVVCSKLEIIPDG